MEKSGVLDPARMRPRLETRSEDELGIQAEMSLPAVHEALAQAGRAADRRRCGDRRVLESAAGLPGGGDRDPGRARRRWMGLRHERGVFVGDVLGAGSRRCAAQRVGELRGGGEPGDHLGAQQLRAARLPLHLRRRLHGAGARTHRRRSARPISGRCSAPSWSRSSPTTSATTSGSSTVRRSSNATRRSSSSVRTARWCSARCARWSPSTSATISTQLDLAAEDVRRFWLHQANLKMNQLIAKGVLGRAPDRGRGAGDPRRVRQHEFRRVGDRVPPSPRRSVAGRRRRAVFVRRRLLGRQRRRPPPLTRSTRSFA